MAEESEKRFTAIMDKLFHAPPKSKLTPPPSSDSKGKKRPSPWSSLGMVEHKSRSNSAEESKNQSGAITPVQPPACRPWDRGDFYRRLATFKSMTWFAKPEAVSAINCARRGWINVDFDTIECEACGARLLISTPQSWTQEQVEKTARVFSLKLDSGHKLLCPWVDNICDDGVARFPPTQTAVLVDNYKARCSALLRLLALPVISSSSIAYMRSPQLEQFLKEHCPEESFETGKESGSVPSTSYYQAQKLISLCGWDAHPLPYSVGISKGQDQFNTHANLTERPHAFSSGQSCSISVFSSSTDGSMDISDAEASHELQFDPNSVVLDCSMCGAKVGLWAFSCVPRPMEFLRVVGHTDINHESHQDQDKELGPESQSSSSERRVDIPITNPKPLVEGSNLSLTIAGGPPPTKQNYRAIISLPVVGRNLRARFSTDSGIKDHSNVNKSSEVCEDREMVVVSENEPSEMSSNGKTNLNVTNPSTSTQVAGQDADRIPENGTVKTVDLVDGKHCGSEAETDSHTTQGDDVASRSRNNLSDTPAEVHNSLTSNSLENRLVESNLLHADHKSMPSSTEKSIQVLPSEKAMEFDPIRQHRPFCPWITSSGNSAPGWQQTLSALQRHKEFSYPLPENTSSLVKVDDPVASVRKLFTPPSSKRSKLVHPRLKL